MSEPAVQLTLRLDRGLLGELKAAAADRGLSLNTWAGRVLRAAVDPELEGDDVARTRARLAAAGLLSVPAETVGPRPSEEALAVARAEAGRGTPLSDFVSDGRGRS